MRAVVIGVGNLLLGDEGVGIHAVRRLQELALPSHVELVDGGTLGVELAGTLRDATPIIIIDAVRLDAPAGTVVRFTADQLPGALSAPSSAHDSSLLDVLAFAGSEIDLSRIVVFGVIPDDLRSVSLSLSSRVSAALPGLIEAILAELERGPHS